MDELKLAIAASRPGTAEELFGAFFERGFEACILAKPDGSVLAANPRACALFGYSAGELIAGGRAAVTRGDDPRLAQLVAERDRIGYVRGQLSMCRKDGSRFEAELSSSIFTVASGDRYATIIVRDLTERLLAERRIAASEERLRFATDAARMGYWDTDLVSGEGFRSPSLFALFGFAAPIAQWSTEKFLALLHPDDRERTGDAYRESTTRGTPYDVEFRVVWPDGSVHWMWAQGRIHLNDSGRPRRALGVQIDITRQKEAELAVRRLNEELEERVLARTRELTLANQELEAFSYRVAHDLRAPLRSISGFIGLLKEDRAGEWSGETADYFGRITNSAAQMGQLIDATC
jgi:PAS domain S-box-containing protein